MIQVVKPAVFLYECIRILFLTALTVSQFNELAAGTPANLPALLYAAPGALFPLMALFIWLDTVRYRTYLPLFIAGKCIIIFTLAVWLTITPEFTGWSIFIRMPLIVRSSAINLLLLMDIMALSAVILIFRYNNQKEETQCE